MLDLKANYCPCIILISLNKIYSFGQALSIATRAKARMLVSVVFPQLKNWGYGCYFSHRLFTVTTLFLVFEFTLNATAQIPNNECTGTGIFAGGIKVIDEVGCVPMKIVAFNTVSGNSDLQYVFDYKGSSPSKYVANSDSNYVYSKPGTYMVMQLSKKDGQELRACKLITVQDTIPPVFRVQICSNGSVTLLLLPNTANNYNEYGIDWGDGKAEIINSSIKTVTHQYPDETTRRINVQGFHKLGRCGGRAVKVIVPDIVLQTPVITKLSISGNTAELTISNPNELELNLLSQPIGSGFIDTGKIIKQASETTKVLIDTNIISCYKLRPTDACIANLESNVLCTSFIQLTAESDKNVITLNPYISPSAVKKLTVLRKNVTWKTPNKTELTVEDTEPTCNEKTCYRLQIETQKGAVLTNIVCANPPLVLCNLLGQIYLPDAFSPNGDGLNDTFWAQGDIPADFTMTVFDKWGTSVFYATSPKTTWNGTLNGQLLPSGSYLYQIKTKDKAGLTFEKRGFVLLVR
jgi:gliding motility-associated-like protein